MRLVVKQNDHTISDLQFSQGPINIGRHADSQIFLSDRSVSRHHAVIFKTQDSKWFVEDLDSTNKTYLNGNEVHKAEIKSGDSLRITDFNIEIVLDDEAGDQKPINLEDTLTTSLADSQGTRAGGDTAYPVTTRDPLEPEVITRKIDANHAPDIKLPAKRAKDFMFATEAICRTNGVDDVLHILLNIAAKQFNAFHIWCGLKNQVAGPIICHGGKQRDSSIVLLTEIKLHDRISEAMDKKEFLLFPRIPPSREKVKINSAMIAPLYAQSGCFGVLYIDNDKSHEHYSLSDLDYLMLIAIHTAVILENF